MRKLTAFSILMFFTGILIFANSCDKDDKKNTCPKNATLAKKINLQYIHANDIPQLFASKGIKYNKIETLNWPDLYPYLPQIDFAIAHNGTNLLIHYRVTEKRTIGTMEQDLDGVYKESCCELFCMKEGDNLYYNIESNCIGSILMECGSERSNRVTSTQENLRQIERWASLGRNKIGHIDHETHWELALVIPSTALWKHSYGTFSGKTFLANVYNCVGSSEERQYVTWQPIVSPTPDFHRPEFFKHIYFEE